MSFTGQIADHDFTNGCCAMPRERHPNLRRGADASPDDVPIPAFDPQPGAVVRLKSGGSAMTVLVRGTLWKQGGEIARGSHEAVPIEVAEVAWLDDQNRAQRETYPVDALRSY